MPKGLQLYILRNKSVDNQQWEIAYRKLCSVYTIRELFSATDNIKLRLSHINRLGLGLDVCEREHGQMQVTFKVTQNTVTKKYTNGFQLVCVCMKTHFKKLHGKTQNPEKQQKTST